MDESTPLDPKTERQRLLAAAEQVVLTGAIDGTVARLAGLYGPGRYPIDRYREGPIANRYVNWIHRDDAAGALRYLLATDRARNDIVLVVDDEPVTRWELADWIAKRLGSDPPKKERGDHPASIDGEADRARREAIPGKRCSNETLRSMGYELTYPSFRSGLVEVL